MNLLIKISTKFAKKPKQQSPINPQLLAEFNAQKIHHRPNKNLPQTGTKNILVTAALPYVNNTPHLGNIIGAVLSADVYARFCRLRGYNVLFVCGTDQYGTATQVKAIKENSTPQQICDQYHQTHKKIYEWFDISFDVFGRTSSQQHTKIVQQVFQRINQKDHIIPKSTKQLHCQNCDLFLADRFINGICKKCGGKSRGDQCQVCNRLVEEPVDELDQLSCGVCGKEPQVRDTEHLHMKFEGVIGRVKNWLIEEKGMENWSNNAKGMTKSWLDNPNEDRCISRDLKWGVPIPIEKYSKKVFYVWFEATLGYMSITSTLLGQNYKKWWLKQKAKIELNQFMGKDNIIFHSIINPSTLLLTNKQYVLPKRLSVTQYLNYEGGKFSKSLERGIFADQCQQTGINNQNWRYYLLSNRPQHFDCEFRWEQFRDKVNGELSNSVGNLINRVLSFAYRKYGGEVPQILMGDIEKDVLNQISEKLAKFVVTMENAEIKYSLILCLEISFILNKYVQETQFWKSDRKDAIIGFLLRIIKVYGHIIQPFVPSFSAKLFYLLGCEQDQANKSYLNNIEHNLQSSVIKSMDKSKGLKSPQILIQQITDDQVNKYKLKFNEKQ